MRLLQVAMVLVVLMHSSLASAQPNANGDFWRQLSPNTRAAFVAGILASKASEVTVAPAVACLDSPDRDRFAQCYASQQRKFQEEYKDFVGIGAQQFVDGLDAFFSDYKNRQIQVVSALRHVAMSIRGVPQAQLNDYAEQLRRAATQ
jgi:hypothetical protein